MTLTPGTVQPGDEVYCIATVTDGDGGSTTDQTFVVVENTAPVVTDVTISPDTGITTRATLTCSGAATDADGGTPSLSYQWAKQAGGTGTPTNISSATTNTLTLSPTVVQPGDNILCRITATDADGGSAQGTDVVTVDNSDPVVTDVQIRPDTNVTTSTTLTCTATATDPDGGTPSLSYQWAKQAGGTFTTDTLALSASVVQPTTISSAVSPTTQTVEQGTDVVTVDNSDPVVTDVQIRPDTNVTTSTTLTCTATATDPDGGTPSLSYQWAKQTSGTGTPANISSATQYFDTFAVRR